MNNEVSKENAIGLKEIGYAEECGFYYDSKGSFWSGEHINNSTLTHVSAPDFLTAADWFAEEHKLAFIFHHRATRLLDIDTPEQNEIFESTATGYNYDHRNVAIEHAILIVKERREKGGGE